VTHWRDLGSHLEARDIELDILAIITAAVSSAIAALVTTRISNRRHDRTVDEHLQTRRHVMDALEQRRKHED
jgi:hypothetical protein